MVTDKFPEFEKLSNLDKDGFIIDGALLVFADNQIKPFSHLQKRIGRRTIGKKILSEYPCVIFAFDLLEYEGQDYRYQLLTKRHKELDRLVEDISGICPDLIFISNPIKFSSWPELIKTRNTARSMNAVGLMFKIKNGIYRSGRYRGEWWKWRLDPYSIDAVLLYAQRGPGRRSNLYTDFTFAVWGHNDNLTTFTKTSVGLTEEELEEITKFVKNNTIEKFGPVRSIKPELVFKITFEDIDESKRHKSGVTLRNPRIEAWLKEKTIVEANTLQELKRFLS